MNDPDPHEFPEHAPGDHHQYELICKVCGQLGMVRIVLVPETYPTTDPTHAAPAVHREGADPTSADQPEDAGTAGTFDEGGEG